MCITPCHVSPLDGRGDVGWVRDGEESNLPHISDSVHIFEITCSDSPATLHFLVSFRSSVTVLDAAAGGGGPVLARQREVGGWLPDPDHGEGHVRACTVFQGGTGDGIEAGGQGG